MAMIFMRATRFDKRLIREKAGTYTLDTRTYNREEAKGVYVESHNKSLWDILVRNVSDNWSFTYAVTDFNKYDKAVTTRNIRESQTRRVKRINICPPLHIGDTIILWKTDNRKDLRSLTLITIRAKN